MARILTIDDDPSILALERLLLTEAGHEIISVGNARAGLNLLKSCHVDLVIVDIIMPELNGFQFVNLLRANTAAHQAPVAFLTSKGQRDDILKAGEVGADFYIVKPLDEGDFLRRIANFFTENPPQDPSHMKLVQPREAKAKILSSAQITAISDIGFEILTTASLAVDQEIELSSSFFAGIPIKCPPLRVLSITEESKDLISARLMFVTLDKGMVQNIQKWIAANRRKP